MNYDFDDRPYSETEIDAMCIAAELRGREDGFTAGVQECAAAAYAYTWGLPPPEDGSFLKALPPPKGMTALSEFVNQTFANEKKIRIDSDYVIIPLAEAQEIYDRLKRLTNMGQASVNEWIAMSPEMVKLRQEVFHEGEFGCMTVGNWLSEATISAASKDARNEL